MFTITTERPEDGPAIEALLDTAFGPSRESKVSYRYRASVAPVANLKLVARDAGDRIIGTVRYWPVLVGHVARPGLLLGPLAVAQDWQANGVGAALMRRSLDMAQWARHERVLLVGDYGYYKRFGFRPAAPYGIVMPGENPARLLALPLSAGALDGVAGPLQPWRWVRRRGRRLRAA
ncbi:MAG TPA: N-acetyltransferase [Alphaproteobacteria bacterium]|nr:N-acetyltransferase [Alphaproteobacteria bacterium]